MATKIRPINLHTTVDTHIQGLIDSSYITARASSFDSSSATGLIDSDYVAARSTSADSATINTLVKTTTITGKIKADIRSNPNALARAHTIDSNSNGLLVGPINVDSGITLTINGTLMVV